MKHATNEELELRTKELEKALLEKELLNAALRPSG
jgi:hypothetical protein